MLANHRGMPPDRVNHVPHVPGILLLYGYDCVEATTSSRGHAHIDDTGYRRSFEMIQHCHRSANDLDHAAFCWRPSLICPLVYRVLSMGYHLHLNVFAVDPGAT